MAKNLTRKEEYPAPSAPEQDRAAGAGALKLYYEAFNLLSDGIYAGNVDAARALVDQIESALASADALKAALACQKQRATTDRMVEYLMVLVKSFPDRQGEDARIFGRALAEEVGRMRPSIGALEAACGHLRRTITRPLYIADVVQAIEDHEGKFERWISAIDQLGSQRGRIVERLAAIKRPAG